MLAEERHRKICETVLSRGTVTTVELMELLDASESTVRRDLAELEQRRRLVRVHGGASRIGNGYVLRDQALDEKHFLHAGEKQTIASFAASLIKPGDFVYLDAGSTTEALADCIEERDATYLTNSLPIARKLLARGCKTLLPGGTLSGLPTTLWSNPEAEQLFKEWRDRFDYILIDSSAAASCSESGLIARLADGCIYLGQEDRVQPGDVRKGAAAVTAAGCRILGCVFTADH